MLTVFMNVTEENGITHLDLHGLRHADVADEVSAAPRQNVPAGLLDRFRSSRWLSNQLRNPHRGSWWSSDLCRDAKQNHLTDGSC